MTNPRIELIEPLNRHWEIDDTVVSQMEDPSVFNLPVDIPILVPAQTINIKFAIDEFPVESISGCPFNFDDLL
jgi:hypothetical protein